MTRLLSAEGVTKAYGKRSVLRGVTFDANRGEVLGFVAPNGAGKTTLLRVAVGLLRCDAGVVLLEGEPLPQALGKVTVSYFGGGSTMPPAVRGRTWRGLFHETDAAGEARHIRLLSRGTRQLLGLRTLFSLPRLELIVLDEPWEGLDPDASRWLTQSIRARRDAGAAVLVSSHRLHELAEVCDRCAFLMDGGITLVDARNLSGSAALTGAALLEAFDALRP